MYRIFGYINVALVAVVTAPYWLRKLNQWIFKATSNGWQKFMKVLRALHKPLAALLLVSIAVHGWLALGAFRLHTGTLAEIAFFFTALFGLLFYAAKKPPLLKWHKGLALAAVLLAAVHLLFPGLLYTLGIA